MHVMHCYYKKITIKLNTIRSSILKSSLSELKLGQIERQTHYEIEQKTIRKKQNQKSNAYAIVGFVETWVGIKRTSR